MGKMVGKDNGGGNGNVGDGEAPLRDSIDILYKKRLVQQVAQSKELEQTMGDVADSANSTGLMHDNAIRNIRLSVTSTHNPLDAL